MLRQPRVAGSFYPSNKDKLIQRIEMCFTDEQIGPGQLPDTSKQNPRKGDIYSVISPHAGLVYSGPVAAHSFLEQFQDGKPDFFVIIGPNHNNIGPAISVYPDGAWNTPLGDATIPEDITEIIIKQPHFRSDTSAHMMEHSIEVQVPFLQYLYGEDVPIIPICLKDQSLAMSERVGTVLSKVLVDYDYCLIASTDLTHYESKANAMSKDSLVIDSIRKMDPEKLMKTVIDNQISMCGPGPVASVLYASNKLKITNAKILKYATSGDVTGDDVGVSYLAALITK
ncbi:MAG: AmmeMemoRadiSam system protein B [Asgard group archaeon]|nr:AmmeMemoRadiSam system protein B [Asgard group archaeon]